MEEANSDTSADICVVCDVLKQDISLSMGKYITHPFSRICV